MPVSQPPFLKYTCGMLVISWIQCGRKGHQNKSKEIIATKYKWC